MPGSFKPAVSDRREGEGLDFVVREDETLEDLQLGNLFLIQKRDSFRFGMDAVLLANFVKVKPGQRIVDLGTGSAVIPILLAAKTEAGKIIGIEIQQDIADMASRSVRGNRLEDRIEIHASDIRFCTKELGSGYDIVVSNPPYTRAGSGLLNPHDAKALSRHELLCTLSDVLAAAASLLKYHGRMYLVHRPDRLCDVMVEMRLHGIEPKELRLVCPRIGDPASLILVEGVNKGNPGMKVLPPLYIYDASGDYSDEAMTFYTGSN
jgi:tRNA1Val (adenine37-N6)-methyltransferase